MLGIKETGERVTLTFDRGVVAIGEDGDVKSKLLLSEGEMVNLIFNGSETVNIDFPVLKLIFPLPLYVGLLD